MTKKESPEPLAEPMSPDLPLKEDGEKLTEDALDGVTGGGMGGMNRGCLDEILRRK